MRNHLAERPNARDAKRNYEPPQRIRLFHEGRLHRPFVYGRIQHVNPETSARTYTDDTSKMLPIRLWIKGDAYRLWGLLPMDRHIIGLDDSQRIYLLGSDRLGHDLLTRILYGSRVSLSLGLVGVFLSLVLGIAIGGISGFYGGIIDTIIQRVIEIFRSIPASLYGSHCPPRCPPTGRRSKSTSS